MEFRLLGNLEVVNEGAPVDVGGTQPRTVLAMLLVAGGRVVPAESIIDALWGHEPPDSAAGTLQSYMSRLRRALVPGRARGEGAKVLVWHPPGYKLVVEPEALDTRRFESLADRGRALLDEGDPAGARRLLDEALGLWRGPALLEFSHLDFAWGYAARLEERRMIATEDRIEADLQLGRHAAVVGELGELVAANPLREQFRHHLALALYRSGRQAEALRVLDDARRTLRDQLGIDPGRPLTDLEAAILAHDPALTQPVAVPVGGARAGAGPAAGGPTAGAGAGTAPIAAAAPPERGAAPPTAPLPGLAGFVGRELELRQALAALDEAREGARVVLVEGEPGIGKTRLVEEVAAEAARRSVAVHWGRAFEGGATPALWPWLAPLRAIVAGLGPDEVAPELGALVGGHGASHAGDGDGALVGASPADHARVRLFDAVTRLVATAATERPLVLVLDDLQWADLPSLELLTFLAGQLGDEPVLLACTVRELEVGRRDAVVDALAALSRGHATRRITLRGISHLATAELVERAAGGTVEPDVIAAIQRRAEGNPFFATELARLVAAEPDRAGALGAVSPGGDVPSGVRDVVRQRIALLPEPTTRLLQVAAVCGRDVDLDLLVSASDEPMDGVLDGLDPAVVHRLLAPVPERPATFRFSHALVREVLADDVSALRRARIHLRVADAIEAATAGDADAADDAAEILAEHLWAAVPIGTGQRAALALERAAEVAVRRYAFEAAEGMLARAVELRRAAGGAGQDVEAELRTTSRLLSIQRSLHGYASVTDTPHLRRAKDLAARAGRVDVLARLLWTEWAAYDTRCDLPRSASVARQLHDLAEGADDPIVRVTGLASLGISHWHAGRVAEASALLDEAVRAGEGARPPDLTVGLDLEVLLLPHPFSRFLHVLAGDLGGPVEAEAAMEALVDAAPDRYAVSLVEMLAAGAALTVGEPAWAERAARRGIDADPDATFTFWGRGLHVALAAALIEQGRVDEGLPSLEPAVERYVAAGGRTGLVVFRASQAGGLIGAGRLSEAADALAVARRELEGYGDRYAEPLVLEVDARLRLARGDEPAEATDLLSRAVGLAAAGGAHGIERRVVAAAARRGVDIGG
ncbi:MAG TPA: BTAD domain-containing putative transcriptional regulator [Acidimicrobiales bacterium]|nr:BTAD domain-containing putative transcriptional regulator [Acidimicrobiales bacterium]